MSDPVVENIAEDIKAAINAITTDNGFNQDLVAIRPKRNDFRDIAPENGKVLIVQWDEGNIEDSPIGCQDWRQTFILQAMVIDSDDATDPIDSRINQVRGDIQKKLMADNTRSGYAIDTALGPSGKFDDGKGGTGIAIAVDVYYRVQLLDPYTQG